MGEGSESFSRSSLCITRLYCMLACNSTPAENRLESLAIRKWPYELPSVTACAVTPVYCGYVCNRVERFTVAPFRFVPGTSPANGFGNCADRKLIVAESRAGAVLRYCPGK